MDRSEKSVNPVTLRDWARLERKNKEDYGVTATEISEVDRALSKTELYGKSLELPNTTIEAAKAFMLGTIARDFSRSRQ